MKAKKTWVLVADGKRGRLFKRESALVGLEAALDRDFSQPLRRTREIGTDRPGRVQESANSASHAMTPRVDWLRQEKQRFAATLAEFLEVNARRKAFERLVLVAPPQALGDLRAALGRHARDRLSGELDKDLTELPPKKIETRLIEKGLL